MRTAVSVLDDALDRVSGLDFEVPNPFVNHAPMACEALAALGFEDAIDAWVRRFEGSMGRAVLPIAPSWGRRPEWRDLLGDYRLLPEWMGYFDREIAEDGWRDVVATWVPRLMPGLVAALFHGVIRTSHAVRALQASDTRARRAELARALGNWASWFGPGERPDDGRGIDGPDGAILTSAVLGARCYVRHATIFNLHGVTGAMAVHLLSAHLSPADAASAAAQLSAEHRALHRGVRPAEPWSPHEGWDDGVVLAAIESFDSHQVKLVEASRRGYDFTGDRGFLMAAETVTRRAS
jgi:hypothetical protein